MANIVSKTWVGTPPAKCEMCKCIIETCFIDGQVNVGRFVWANVCPSCFETHGIGLGLGKGQKYEKQADGSWLKTGG